MNANRSRLHPAYRHEFDRLMGVPRRRPVAAWHWGRILAALIYSCLALWFVWCAWLFLLVLATPSS